MGLVGQDITREQGGQAPGWPPYESALRLRAGQLVADLRQHCRPSRPQAGAGTLQRRKSAPLSMTARARSQTSLVNRPAGAG